MSAGIWYERLLSALSSLEKLNEFSLLPQHFEPVDLNHPNTTNPWDPFIVNEGNVGVPLYCVPDLLGHAICRLHEANKENSNSSSLSAVEAAGVMQRLDQASTIAMLLNPECVTAVNARKKLVTLGRVSELMELSLTESAQSAGGRAAKSSVLWAHRRWLLQRVRDSSSLPSGISYKSLLEHELAVCSCGATRHPRNYHAWNHRTHVLDLLISSTQNLEISNDSAEGGFHGTDALGRILKAELDAVEKWCSSNVGDTAGWGYRGACVERIVRMTLDGPTISQSKDTATPGSTAWTWAFDFPHDVAQCHPGFESVWAHLRYLWSKETLTASCPSLPSAIDGNSEHAKQLTATATALRDPCRFKQELLFAENCIIVSNSVRDARQLDDDVRATKIDEISKAPVTGTIKDREIEAAYKQRRWARTYILWLCGKDTNAPTAELSFDILGHLAKQGGGAEMFYAKWKESLLSV